MARIAHHDDNVQPGLECATPTEVKLNLSKRRYSKLNPAKPFPANFALYYECTKCGVVLPSAPPEQTRCKCDNIAIEPGRVAIKDPSQARLFSITSAGRVSKDKVLDCLRELADESYQQRVWMGRSPTEMSSLTEAACGLYDDSGLGDALDKREIVFSEEIDTLLRELAVAIQKVDEHGRHPNFVQSREMQRVRRWAAHLLSLVEGEAR